MSEETFFGLKEKARKGEISEEYLNQLAEIFYNEQDYENLALFRTKIY